MIRKLIPALMVAAAMPVLTAHADTVIMKTGTLLEADEVSRDDDSIEFKVEYGTVRVLLDNILRIEKDTPEQIALKEKKAAEAKELAEQMKEEGKIQYKGKWVTEDEKAADEKKVAEVKKKKEKERAEAKKKAEAEAKKKKDAEEKRLAELDRQRQQNYNNNGGFDDVRGDRFAARHGGSSNNRNGRNGGYNNYNNNSNYNNNYRNGSSINSGAIDQLLGGYRRGNY